MHQGSQTTLHSSRYLTQTKVMLPRLSACSSYALLFFFALGAVVDEVMRQLKAIHLQVHARGVERILVLSFVVPVAVLQAGHSCQSVLKIAQQLATGSFKGSIANVRQDSC